MDRISMEEQLFSWEGWDDHGPNDMAFYNVELKVPVGEFPVGTKFPVAFLMGTRSMLLLIDDKEQEHLYDFKISVGEKLEPTVLHNDSCGCGGDHEH